MIKNVIQYKNRITIIVNLNVKTQRNDMYAEKIIKGISVICASQCHKKSEVEKYLNLNART